MIFIFQVCVIIVNAINKLRLPVPICTEMTQSSDVQGNKNKLIIVKVKFILTFTIILVQERINSYAKKSMDF